VFAMGAWTSPEMRKKHHDIKNQADHSSYNERPVSPLAPRQRPDEQHRAKNA
jgi:hypothetical protein